MKEKILPFGKNILVLPEKTKSRVNDYGIRTPDNVEQEQKARGTVIAVGDEVKRIKKGDVVLFAVYAGEVATQEENGKQLEYRFIFEEDIVATIK